MDLEAWTWFSRPCMVRVGELARYVPLLSEEALQVGPDCGGVKGDRGPVPARRWPGRVRTGPLGGLWSRRFTARPYLDN